MSIADRSKAEVLTRLRITEAQRGLQEIRINDLIVALRKAETFIASELENRSASFLPGDSEYLKEPQEALDAVRAAIKKTETPA